ncbi:hypothetical protein OHC33_006227 [Knufia fluminis]|uniref:Uncharacterized protein n=1 Tax=Knufia fluminis TaxID=191047 RepID=A0AAN8ENQ3_9EURO|nr:hypothetical protein OHC33_006227 [Knufia fluminis]
MQLFKAMNFMLLTTTGIATQIMPGYSDDTESHTIGLPEKSIAVYDLPHTFIQRLDARVPDLVTSTSVDTVTTTITTGYKKPTPSAHSVITALTTSITVPIVSAISPSACVDSICQQSVVLGYPFPVTTLLAAWSSDHPKSQTLFNQSVYTSSKLSITYTLPVATVMASSVNPSSFSYSFIAGTTQMFTTTIPGGPGNTSPTPVVSTDSVSGTHGPPPEITATNSFTTISNATATDVVPATLSNNITSPVPTVTSFSVTTVDGSTGALTGTATTTATFGDATSTAASETSTVTTSTGIE